MFRWIAAAIIAAALIASHGFAWRSGGAAEAARAARDAAEVQKRLDAAQTALRAQAAELEAYRQSQAALAREIEDAARSDPGAADRRPSDASRLRLQARWGSSR